MSSTRKENTQDEKKWKTASKERRVSKSVISNITRDGMKGTLKETHRVRRMNYIQIPTFRNCFF